MEDIKIFESNEFGNVRIVLDEKGAPWFVGTDVAKCLGYLKPTDAVRNAVDEEDVIILSSSCKSSIQFGRSLLNQAVREIRLINESGVYSLILQSKIKSARSFKRWVTKEVLPSIRETGSYSSLIKLPNFTDPAEAAEAWAKEYRGRVAAEKLALEEKAKAEEVAKVLESKKEDIEFSESFIMSGESDLLIRDLAKKLEQNDIIISDKCLRDFLVKIKIIKGSRLMEIGRLRLTP
jgi:prophage antirepressor-like protein